MKRQRQKIKDATYWDKIHVTTNLQWVQGVRVLSRLTSKSKLHEVATPKRRRPKQQVNRHEFVMRSQTTIIHRSIKEFGAHFGAGYDEERKKGVVVHPTWNKVCAKSLWCGNNQFRECISDLFTRVKQSKNFPLHSITTTYKTK